MSESNLPTCSTCVYKFVGKDGEAICRRFPPAGHPIVIPGGRVAGMNVEPTFGSVAVYPPVKDDYFCGEHKAKLSLA